MASGLVGSEESDLGFPLHPEYAVQTDADWYLFTVSLDDRLRLQAIVAAP